MLSKFLARLVRAKNGLVKTFLARLVRAKDGLVNPDSNKLRIKFFKFYEANYE